MFIGRKVHKRMIKSYKDSSGTFIYLKKNLLSGALFDYFDAEINLDMFFLGGDIIQFMKCYKGRGFC